MMAAATLAAGISPSALSLDPELKRLLANKFVCVYVDTDTAVGRSLAGAFEVASKGLVISDREGTSQAYSLSGDLTKDELSRTLATYAEPGRPLSCRRGGGPVRFPLPSVPLVPSVPFPGPTGYPGGMAKKKVRVEL